MKQQVELQMSAFIHTAMARRAFSTANDIRSQIGPATHPALWLGSSLAMAIVAQRLLDRDRHVALAAALYALAALAFVLLFRHSSVEPTQDRTNTTRPSTVVPGVRMPWLFVAVALFCGGLSFSRLGANRFTLSGSIWWALGFLFLGLTAWSSPISPFQGGVSAQRSFSRQGIVVKWHQVVLLAIMLLGAFYRLYKIGLIPAEMGCDLPHIYANIRQILLGEWPIFFPSFPGREGLFFYLAAPLASWFGLSHTIIKVAGGLVGVFTLPVMYLVGKELYSREVGLWAAFWLSISHWHIIICRVGYRAATVPLVLGLAWYFLLRALRTERRWSFALSGLFLGLGLYTYNAFMIVPFLFVLIFLSLFAIGRRCWLLGNFSNIILLFIVAAYVFIPLGRYALDEPQSYGFRAATRITSLEAPLPTDILATLLGTTGKALLMFNYRGDAVFVANVPYLRELSFSMALLFIFGLAYVLWRWRRGQNITLLLTLGTMLLPTILSLAFPQEVPNAIRAIGALPPAMILPAVSLTLVRRRAAALLGLSSRVGEPKEMDLVLSVDGATKLRWHWSPQRLLRLAAIASLVVLLGLEVRAVYPVYFRDYVAHLPDANYSISLEMARVIDAFSGNGEAYIKIMPNWYDGNAVRAQLRRTDQNWHNELDELRPGDPPFTGAPGKFMVIAHPQDASTLNALRQAFPRGIELDSTKPDGSVAFVTFYGER